MARSRSISTTSSTPTISPELALKRIQRLVEQIPAVRSAGPLSAEASTFQSNVKTVLEQYYGPNSVVSREFNKIWFSPGMYYSGQPESEFVDALNNGLDQAEGFLRARMSDLSEEIGGAATDEKVLTPGVSEASRTVFVVHGHDHGIKEMVARYLERLKLEPVILHEQPDQGRTIIEKFESHAANVRCAVVLLTADDIGASKVDPNKFEDRARQNVILELGYFVGRLGRKNTFALVERGLTIPSDLHGLIYISLDDGGWRLRLVQELKAAGVDVDANQAF